MKNSSRLLISFLGLGVLLAPLVGCVVRERDHDDRAPVVVVPRDEDRHDRDDDHHDHDDHHHDEDHFEH